MKLSGAGLLSLFKGILRFDNHVHKCRILTTFSKIPLLKIKAIGSASKIVMLWKVYHPVFTWFPRAPKPPFVMKIFYKQLPENFNVANESWKTALFLIYFFLP